MRSVNTSAKLQEEGELEQSKQRTYPYHWPQDQALFSLAVSFARLWN